MEWLEKLKNFPQLIQEEPRYGYLVAVAILLVWLIGIICGWNGRTPAPEVRAVTFG